MNLSCHIESGAVANTLCLRTVASECKPLVLSRPRCRTLKSKHLLLLSEVRSGCIVFAVEIYVYLSFYAECVERHLFVSKADTTGLGEVRISIAGVVEEYLRHLVKIPVQSYIDGARWRIELGKEQQVENSGLGDATKPLKSRQNERGLSSVSEFDIVNTLNELSEKLWSEPGFYHSIPYYSKQKSHAQAQGHGPATIAPKVLTKVCLFTRSAESYIFPYSQKNTKKHIADGNSLFKWWIRVLSNSLDSTWKCKADIPGSDSQAVRRFLPDKENWSIGNLYVEEMPNEKAVYAIPLFPDDPKGRFLEHLIVENRYKTSTTSQFWNELGFRQEFRLGNVVGIISCSEREPQVIKEQKGENDVCISSKNYKKLMETIKGEDFSKKEDIQVLVKNTLPSIFVEAGIEVVPMTFTGTMEKTKGQAIVPVTVLAVKRKGAVNNLTGLVKRKK